MFPVLDDLEIRQAEKIPNVLYGCPVEYGLGILQFQFFSQQEHWLPQPAIPVDDDARVGKTGCVQAIQDELNVKKKNEQVGKDDVVELLALQVQILGGNLAKFQVRIFLLSPIDHFARNIDSQTAAWPDSGEKISSSAS